MKLKFTKQLAEEMAAKGVALIASGAYVHRFFDEAELARAENAYRAPIEYSKEPRLVIVTGRGVLVRPGRPSVDRKFVKFPQGIVTLKLINGEILTESEMARRVAEFPGVKIMELNSGTTRVGILLGSVEEPYATLIYVHQGNLRFHDIETKEHANNRHVLCRVVFKAGLFCS